MLPLLCRKTRACSFVMRFCAWLPPCSWVRSIKRSSPQPCPPLQARSGGFPILHGYIWALGIFVAGSVACSVAPNLISLVGARALQGFGGGGLMTLLQAIIGEVV